MPELSPTLTPKEPLYFGWRVIFALLVILSFTAGLSFYNHAVILNALAQQPNFNIQSASFAISVFFLSGGFAGLWIAKLLDKFDVRTCLCAGAIISCISIIAVGHVSTVLELYIVYALFGIGFSATALLPATTLVTRWFRKRRAFALSIASTGLSVGGVLITPICATLVENLGLTKATPYMGAMYILGIIPVTLLWVRPTPQKMGLMIDGEKLHIHTATVDSSSSSNPMIDGVSYHDAIRGRFFWGVSFAYVFLMLAQVGGIAHQYGLAKEQLNEAQTAMAVAILPVASIIGRLAGGWIIERISMRAFSNAMMILQIVALSLLAIGASPWTLCIGLAFFGITVGNLLMLQPLLIAEAFGLQSYAKLFSRASLLSSWGTACGPAALGFAYTYSQNHYSLPYTVAACAGLIGFACFLAGGPMHRQP